jgi:hypothetical protein
MSHRTFLGLAFIVLGAACAGAPLSPTPAPMAMAAPAESSASSMAAAPVAARAAPRRVALAMAGEPDAAALGEVRLVATACDDLSATVRTEKEALVRRMRAEVDQALASWKKQQRTCRSEMWTRRKVPMAVKAGDGFGRGSLGGVGMARASAAPSGMASELKKESAQVAKSASGTNNQVSGVDEADIVKNDGKYVYLAMNGALRIVEAMNPHIVSVTSLPGNVRDLFVEGDRATVYVAMGGSGARPCTYGYDCVFAGDGSRTKIMVYDVLDRAHPRLEREIELSGSLMAARRIGTTIHTVVSDGDPAATSYTTWPPDLSWCSGTEAAARAKFQKLAADNEKRIQETSTFPMVTDKGVSRPLCERLYKTPLGDGQAFTSVVSFDMNDDHSAVTTSTIQSRPGAVFASASGLYLSVGHQRAGARGWYSFYASTDEASDVHKFRIGASPKETRYVGSGVVPGHVLNQFSMDEWYGYLRIATTRGRVPDPKVESAVSILAEGPGGNLVRTGAIQHIAAGEDIRSVRFDDDRGYVVTFKKTDPLFVLDLYDPQSPAILGELKIPGFSTYMHRIDPNHLLSIGFDANDHGNFAYFDGVILQLFDVTNPTDPQLVHKEKIGTRGSSSEAATDHLAFNFFADRGLLAIPMTICEGGGDGTNGDQMTFSGLLVYDVSIERGFRRLGGVDHGTKGTRCGTWWSNASSAVKRSIFMDDLVFSIATDRMKVQRMPEFGYDVADISLR